MVEAGREGLTIERYFSTEENPYDTVEWTKSNVEILDENGRVKFFQEGVEAPSNWSSLALKVAASKYFYGKQGSKEREYSIKQVFLRTVETVGKWAVEDGYINKESLGIFKDELFMLFLNQELSPNSPFWFNVRTHIFESRKSDHAKGMYIIRDGEAVEASPDEEYQYPQASACFIQSVKDTMEDIMRLANSEAKLFKHGSGTGTDLSTLRSSKEGLSGGGKPSGPLSFMRVYDQIAAVIKSGGKTRRAAKMSSLKVRHPDIGEFITAKTKEEEKLHSLIRDGWPIDEARDSVGLQNANLAIRVTQEFMEVLAKKGKWKTRPVHNQELADQMPEYDAEYLWNLIAESTRFCGDPGIQYDTTINRWHTCPNSGPINASNPCSEYMFIDDSSCNLASLNLMKFKKPDGTLDFESLGRAITLLTILQDSLYDRSSYPEAPIARNSHRFRPLGMGYSNLGALLMSWAVPYDSDEARAIASTITSFITAKVYETSSKLAEKLGPFKEFEKNKEPMLKVIGMHGKASRDIDVDLLPEDLGLRQGKDLTDRLWDYNLEAGNEHGFRNAQATVLAPTGTISFLMDCDTTGIEPDLSLVKYKLLAGGGMLKMVNQAVPLALEKLGYTPDQIESIKKYIEGHGEVEGADHLNEEHCDILRETEEKDRRAVLKKLRYKPGQIEDILCHIDGHGTIEGAPFVRSEHLPIFDCSLKPRKGKRSIHYMGHVKMMAATQPFISGAISKTVNMDKDATVEDIKQVYELAYKLGLKAITIFRDGSKVGQPLSTGEPNPLEKELRRRKPYRRRLPDTRYSITHKFSVAGHEGYLTVGLYEEGTPGELFITMAKEGSTVGGLMDVIGTQTSMALQYGVPVKTLCDKFRHARFEPSGMTSNPDIPFAKSLIDYIFTWIEERFVPGEKVPVDKETAARARKILSAIGSAGGPPDLIKNLLTDSGLEDLNLTELDNNPNEISGPTCMNCGYVVSGRCGVPCPVCKTPDPSGCDGTG